MLRPPLLAHGRSELRRADHFSSRGETRILELRHVGKLYSGIPAVRDVSFIARAGEVTGYLGPNGSGKSTTFKMITGLIEPSEGEILFHGEPISRDRIAYRQRRIRPRRTATLPHLTALNIWRWWGSCAGSPTPRSWKKSKAFCSLLVWADRYVPISSYPKACGRRCAGRRPAAQSRPGLARRAVLGPRCNSALVLRGLIRQLASRGKVVLFSPHESTPSSASVPG